MTAFDDLDPFFDPDMGAVEMNYDDGTVAGKPIWALFSEAGETMNLLSGGIETTLPAAVVRTAQVGFARHENLVRHPDGRQFRIREMQPDGFGLTVHFFTEA